MERLSNEFNDGSSTLATRVFPEKERADLSLFSTSLPVLYHEKLKFDESENRVKPFDDAFMSFSKRNIADEVNDLLEEIEPTTGGTFLPDDEEELLAGLMDGFDVSGLPTQLEDLDDDFFGSGFGMEIETENHENPSFGMPRLYATNILNVGTRSHFGFTNGVGTVSGEHPYGEHPSRTLFVRNINSNVEDSELRCLFEQYGDIRTLYTACKHRGFVMIAYYDIRAARNAMRALQNKPLRRRKLDIHFSIPKDNPSEKDINQGTLVVFNLDPSVSNDDLRQIFGAYGEVKEIRETPHKRFHKFIEYYDVRAAEAALKALNRCDIAGKRIKLEPSRPGGTRRSILQQLNHELEHDDARVIRAQVGSPVANSPPGSWPTYGSPVDQSLLQGYNLSPNLRGLSPVASNNLSGLASSKCSQLSTPVKIPPIGKDSARTSHLNPMIPVVGTTQASAYQPYFSVPSMKFNSSPELASSYSDSKSSSAGTLSGHQFLWGSPTVNSEQNESSAWSSSVKARPFTPRQIGAGFLNPTQHSSHVGSAPSGFPLERHLGFFPGSPETSYMKHAPFGMTNFGHSNGNWGVNIGVPSSMKTGVAFAGNFSENGSPGSRVMPISRNSPMNFGNGSFLGMGATMNDSVIDRSQIRRTDAGGQMEDKKQFQLDLEKIGNGEDNRTTLMIKNIPNKYTSKMLMAVINETHEGAYDFLYLPIDFKNKCNVGYAFINMVSPAQIISFCNVFHGKKWEKFNSEKVASLAYARIQGQTALVSHFQNSSLDKDWRPIIFHSHVQQTSDLKAIFPSGDANILIHNLEDFCHAGDTLDKKNTALP